MKRRIYPLPFVACGLLLVSCRTTESSYDPASTLEFTPETWSHAEDSPLQTDWIESFGSPTLSSLIAESIENNFGLEAIDQQARAAEAAYRITNSARLPSLGANLRSSRARSMVTLNPPVAIEGESHAINLSARWEVDLWNRLGQESSASRAQYRASLFELEAFRLSLAGQVAKAWFNTIEAKTQYELAEASAESFDSKLQTLERRYARGLVEALDLRLSRAQVSSTRAAAISRRNALDTTLRTLETLLGRYPSAGLSLEEELPELTSKPAAGLPSELLARRPDILAEQQRLLAALALEKSALRNWLPSLSLTASDGGLSSDFSNLLDNDFNVWSIAGDLSLALFQSGRLKAQRDQLNANQLSQLARYKSTALTAFREVETSLKAEEELAALESQTEISANENQLAEEQAWKLYERGIVDITTVLDAERRSFDSRSQLVSIRNQRLQNRINLHLALGGSY
ncbi:efflux transporter outer membrane subunit [Pelagicoccus albus]|uniref:TolC family protein n=1 Tax=Pelagicoccus albus TaxID=415222 RepID=A0A7X1B465_9BACT|nr:TolC family protein [Pelagicoccus albus]MBC2605348.1 TolC family protein [Pelagicoccus albus]